MRQSILLLAIAASSAASLFACSGDDTNPPAAAGSDAGHDATASDAQLPLDSAPPLEAASDGGADALVDGGTGPYLLMTYAFDNYQKSEYAAFDLGSAQTRGRLQYTKYGTNTSTAKAPWVLNQHGDVIMKMDPAAPWNAIGAWSVAEPKSDAGGLDVSDPWSVAESDTEAYVALYNRDVVPVIDTTSATLDGGPAKTVSLASLVQAGDSDGYVEATAAIYDAKRKRVWIVLGNIDLNNVDPQGFFLICTPSLKSTIVAIDTTTDALIPSATITLAGVEPVAIAYDAAGDRLIVESAGCNEPVDGGADAGPGPIFGRVIEEVKLDTGAATTLLDANAQAFPGPFVYADAHRAFANFGGVTFAWDPTSTTLGAALASAPDSFVWDGKGKLVGPKTTFLADGGVGSIDVIAVDPADGGVTTIGSNPVSSPDPGGYFEGVDLWPHP